MSPMDWYGDLDTPGHFPSDGHEARVYGGPFDGARRTWPLRSHTIETCPPGRPGIADRIVYSLHQRACVPKEGCEGPVGVEWVWMTHGAFLLATGGSETGGNR